MSHVSLGLYDFVGFAYLQCFHFWMTWAWQTASNTYIYFNFRRAVDADQVRKESCTTYTGLCKEGVIGSRSCWLRLFANMQDTHTLMCIVHAWFWCAHDISSNPFLNGLSVAKSLISIRRYIQSDQYHDYELECKAHKTMQTSVRHCNLICGRKLGLKYSAHRSIGVIRFFSDSLMCMTWTSEPKVNLDTPISEFWLS